MKNMQLFLGKGLSFYLIYLFFSFLSCDSGDIYPEEYQHTIGTVVKASFSFKELETFPTSYQVLFGAFGESKMEPIVSKIIVKPKNNQPVVVTLSNLPDDATTLKLCLTTLGKQPVFTFYEMNIPLSFGDSIFVPEQEIHLMQYDRIQKQVFSSCVACHGNSGYAELSLLEGVSYSGLINTLATRSLESKKRVVPSDIESSFLIDVLKQGDLLKTNHTSLLAKYDDDLTLLKMWIANGANEE